MSTFLYKNVDFMNSRHFCTILLMMKSINHHKPTMGESIRGFEITIFVPDKIAQLNSTSVQRGLANEEH